MCATVCLQRTYLLVWSRASFLDNAPETSGPALSLEWETLLGRNHGLIRYEWGEYDVQLKHAEVFFCPQQNDNNIQ